VKSVAHHHDRRRLSTLAWTAPLLVAVLVAVSGWWTSATVKSAMKQQLTSELQTILSADVTALEIWINTQRRIAIAVAGDPTVVALSESLQGRLDVSPGLNPVGLEEMEALRDYLETRLSPLGYSFVVVDESGEVICGPSDDIVGMRLVPQQLQLFERLFSSGQSVLVTPFKPPVSGGRTPLDRVFERMTARGRLRGGAEEGEEKEDVAQSFMQVSAPISRASGSIVAGLGLIIRPEQEFTRILSVARSGHTGETFAFDRTGLLISRSRFEDQLRMVGLLGQKGGLSSALNIELRDPGKNLLDSTKIDTPPSSWPLTHMVSRAVEGGVGVEVEGVRDYRGVNVVGAWQWLPQYGFGVATKVDATEAYQPLSVLQWAFTTLFLMLLLCGVAMSLFSYLNLNLRQQVEEVALEAKELGQYTLLKRIGQGGMGAVYKARHALMRRETAVKLLLPEKADQLAIRRFEREVQMTSRLSHPNTIQIYDYGHTPEGIFYYAMEYLEGISLKELVVEYGPLPESRIIHVLRQVCASLKEAHTAHLVHRDIKPANVFLCERGGILDTVKVLDFGLVMNFREMSKQAGAKKQPRSVTGTPQFFSPEAIESPYTVDQRSDLYSLGAMSYFLLTGEHVFEAETAKEICEMQVSKIPERPSERTGGSFCPVLERVIMLCLEKNPDARPQSVEALLSVLQESAYFDTWNAALAADWWESHHLRSRIVSHAQQLEETVKIQPTIRVDIDRRIEADTSPSTELH
jgi:eukaryotic-like serine/threonine-protein kinase